MPHVGVLPHHDRCGDVLHNLRWVIVDEAHVYRGVFGSHVANVLRDYRLARAYGAEPKFLLASATIANLSLAEARPGAGERRGGTRRAQGRAQIVLGTRRSSTPSWVCAAARSPTRLRSGRRARRTVAPARSASPRAARPPSSSTGPPSIVWTPRPDDRVDPVPRRLHAGAATEDRAAPRGGRPARRHRDGRAQARDRHRAARSAPSRSGFRHGRLAAAAMGPGRAPLPRARVLVASDDALDQFFMREPEALLGAPRRRPPSRSARTRACSTLICGRPRSRADHRRRRGHLGPRRCRRAAGPTSSDTWPGSVWSGRDYPAARVSLRSGDTEAFTVVEAETGAVLGQVERERAWSTVHEGAVYLHLGDQYVVQTLDRRRAPLSRGVEVDWYTQRAEGRPPDRGAAPGRSTLRRRPALRPARGH